MANHKSAVKRTRQNKVRNERNTVKRSATRTAIKKVREAIEAGDKAKANELLVNAQKLIAKLAKANIVKKNNAARKTSRLASQVSKL